MYSVFEILSSLPEEFRTSFIDAFNGIFLSVSKLVSKSVNQQRATSVEEYKQNFSSLRFQIFLMMTGISILF